MRYYFNIALMVGFLLSSLGNNVLAQNSLVHQDEAAGIISNDKVANFLSAFVEFSLNLAKSDKGERSGVDFYVPGALNPNHATTLANLAKNLAPVDPNSFDPNGGIYNITANFLKIETSDKGNIYFELTTPNSDAVIAKAELSRFGMSQSHDYQKGQVITLQCKDPIKSDIIILSKCQRLVAMPTDVSAYSRHVVEQFLAGKNISSLLVGKTGSNAAEKLFSYGYIANLFPVDENCNDVNTIRHCPIVQWMFSDMGAQFDNIIEGSKYMDAHKKYKEFYHLD